MPLRDLLLQIERELWRSNGRLYRNHLHDNAVLVFGETGVMDKAAALNAIEKHGGMGRRWEDVSFSDARAVEFTDDAAMLTYRADARNARNDSPYAALASSLYTKRAGQWRLAFHQQTPLNGQSPATTTLATRTASRTASRHPAAALGALAVGAMATGVAAVGAMAVGRLAVGALAVRRGHIGSLRIENLEVHRFRIDDASGV